MIIGNPLVSIIACCYNHERFLLETLNSIKAQTYVNIELIVIDDFSTDSSVKKINNWIKKNEYKCLFIQNTENLGIVKTLNKALKKCTGKYFSMISCDDFYLPNKLENQLKIFETLGKDYVAIYSDAYIIDEFSQNYQWTHMARKKLQSPPHDDIYEQLLLKDNFIQAASLLYKKEIIDNLGFFDESLAYEDYDMILKLSRTYKFYFSSHIDTCYRKHQSNMTNELNKPIFIDTKIKILFKHLSLNKDILKLNKLIKERIIEQCELLYLYKSEYAKLHLKNLKNRFNYGKLAYYALILGLNFKFYLLLKVFLKRDNDQFIVKKLTY